jgi:3-dehydroquinate dehydratase-2
MKKILILNGPNLNLLGRREPQIYGSNNMDNVLVAVQQAVAGKAEIEYAQSNHEGAIIDELHRVGFDTDNYLGVVLNAGAYTHTSLAIADAISAITLPVIEVHISNVFAREEVRHHSAISPVCRGIIAGLGTDVYTLAALALSEVQPLRG